MVTPSTEITERLASLRKEIDETCSTMTALADTHQKRAEHARALDVFFRSVTAILAVAAPALVTYSTAAGVAEGFKLLAIFLTGIAGAATTLQAIFGFKQSYLRAGTSALELRNAVVDLRDNANVALKQKDELEAVGLIRSYLEHARKRMTDVVGSLQLARLKDYETS